MNSSSHSSGDRKGPQPSEQQVSTPLECHKLDTPAQVFFYEQDFYVLSNFSAFRVTWAGRWSFDTAEALYHWLRFSTGDADGRPEAAAIARRISNAASAHDAFRIAQDSKRHQRGDWDAVKVGFMRKVLREKALQHEYVRRKLLQTGDRELIEDSWRDDYWGWGPNRDGRNMLGKLWMEVRAELRGAPPEPAHADDDGGTPLTPGNSGRPPESLSQPEEGQ